MGLCNWSNQIALMVKVQFRKATKLKKLTLPLSSIPVFSVCEGSLLCNPHCYFTPNISRCGDWATGNLLREKPPRCPWTTRSVTSRVPIIEFSQSKTHSSQRLKSDKVPARTVLHGCVAGTPLRWQLPQCSVTLESGMRRFRRGCEDKNHIAEHGYGQLWMKWCCVWAHNALAIVTEKH